MRKSRLPNLQDAKKIPLFGCRFQRFHSILSSSLRHKKNMLASFSNSRYLSFDLQYKNKWTSIVFYSSFSTKRKQQQDNEYSITFTLCLNFFFVKMPKVTSHLKRRILQL